MKIGIGSDHRGVKLKAKIIKYLREKDHDIQDFGTKSESSVDYPDIGYKVSKAVSSSEIEVGILLCYTGIGMSIISNKVKGVFSALVYSRTVAQYAREHNNANVLVIPAGFISAETVFTIIDIFLTTPFSGYSEEEKRHLRRVEKIISYEQQEK